MRYRPIRQPLDLAVPYSKPLPAVQTHTVEPPPQDDPLVMAVAQKLADGASVVTTAAALSVLMPDIPDKVLIEVLHLANRGTRHIPNNAPAKVGLAASTALMRVTRGDELHLRAAYIINAARRITADVANGEPIRVALADESLNYRKHEKARQGRLGAAAEVGRNAEMFGDLLGWYINPLLNNEIECIKADGNNFEASKGTIIGLPGSVHANCGCKAGPPIAGAGMVNDAVLPILRRPGGKKYTLRLTG